MDLLCEFPLSSLELRSLRTLCAGGMLTPAALADEKLRQRETVKHFIGGRGKGDLVAGTDSHRFVGQCHPIGREE